MKILQLLSICLLAGSISAISDLNWNAHDEDLVGGKTRGSSSIQLSIDNSERLTNGVFDLYRILSSNNDRLNQIVSNVHQTVGKDTYSINHVFKHIKNGNYYVEIDTDKYNFAINVVRMPISQHSHNADGSVRPATSRPSSTSVPQTEAKQTTTGPPTTAEPTGPPTTSVPQTEAKQTSTGPPTTTEPTKTTTRTPSTTTEPATTARHPSTTTEPATTARPPSTTAETGKTTITTRPSTTSEPATTARPPSTTAEPAKTTTTTRPSTTSEPATTARPPSTTAEPAKQTTTEPKTTATQQEIEKLRAQENKRFNQILGQWLFAGVKSTDLSSNYGYMACDMITIFTHGTQFYYKVLEYKGNGTYEMRDTHIESIDKKNSLFKMGSNVYSYKLQSLEGKTYKKVKILQITNLNNSSDVSLFTEQPVNSKVLSNVFSDHFSNLQITKIDQVCNDD
jgi:hypothetical protein